MKNASGPKTRGGLIVSYARQLSQYDSKPILARLENDTEMILI